MTEVKTCCTVHFIKTRPHIFSSLLIVCPKCGNKRCPKASWCGYKCTGSNEPGQVAEEEEGNKNERATVPNQAD